MKKNFKILSIDGGGIRGIYSAIILREIENKFNIKLYEHFDLIAGTSTGSILAAAVATHIPLQEVIDLYEKEGEKIFEPRISALKGLNKSRYSNTHLKKLLEEKFKDKTLSDESIKTRLLIPTTDISNGDVHVIKSFYIEEFKRDKNRKIRDVVLSSCSAPLYFDPIVMESYLLADGGLWANNPSLVALTEGIGKIKYTKEIEKITLENTKLLSIGTGIGHKYYNTKNPECDSWGFMRKWGKSKLIDTILNLQSINVHNTVNFMLSEENYLRINFESDNKLSLDSIEIISSLKSKAEKAFTHNSEKIKELLEL